MKHNVLAISYAKRVLEAGSREQQRMLEFAAELDRYVMVVFTREADGLAREYHAGNFSVYGTHSKTKAGILWDAYRLGKKVLRSYSNESWVVSSQNPFEASLVGHQLSKQKNANHHVQVHGDNFDNAAWLKESKLNYWRQRFGLFVLRRASGVRVVSDRIKKALVELGIETALITVLPVKIKLEPFLSICEQRSAVTKTTTQFLYVGRFESEKNVSWLIEAFAEAHQLNPAIRLRLVGDGRERSKLETLIIEKKLSAVIQIEPWTNDVPALMSEAEVLVLTSKHEGYALVLLEAMAAGLALLTTEVGCVGEIVNNDHGCVVAVDDTAALVSGMVALASDETTRKKFAQAGHQTAKVIAKSQSDYGARWKEAFFA